MRTACRPTRLSLLLACLAVLASAPSAGADDPGALPADVVEAVRARVDAGTNVGIVLGVVTPEGTRFHAYGTTTMDGDAPVGETTLFEIGSVAKPITALLLADSVERGDLSLDDPIDGDLPASVDPPSQAGFSIRYRHLATHTSGLPPIPANLDPADWDNPYADYTLGRLYEAISGFELNGLGAYAYSNLGFGLLGLLLELRYGASYESLVIDRICDVLGMPDTRATLSGAQRARTATGYRDGAVFPIWDNPTLAGAGCLLSTVKDLTLFVAANLGLIDSPLDAAMRRTHRIHVYGAIPVGLGWHMLDTPSGGRLIEHHGATGGTWSYVGFLPEEGIGVVVLTNTYVDSDDLGRHLLDPGWPLAEHEG